MTEEEKPNSFKRMIKGGVIKRAELDAETGGSRG